VPRSDGGLRSHFREHLPQVHWCSIESQLTGSGIPDSNGCLNGVEFWIEFKLTSGWAVTLRPAQYAWGTRRARSGGRVFCAVRRLSAGGPRKGPPVDDLWLVPTRHYLPLFETGLKAFTPLQPPGVRFWEGGPAVWNWAEILATLIIAPV
jgi:hypothetical protein